MCRYWLNVRCHRHRKYRHLEGDLVHIEKSIILSGSHVRTHQYQMWGGERPSEYMEYIGIYGILFCSILGCSTAGF